MSTALAAARAKTKGKRMLRNALDAYGDEDASLSQWNARKTKAVEEGKWRWKERVVNTNATIKSRWDKEEAQVADVQQSLELEMRNSLHVDQQGERLGVDRIEDQCNWRARIGGKLHHCINLLPRTRKKKDGRQEPTRFCLWHVTECSYSDHPMEKSPVIEIPNEFGMCLHCYEVTAGTRGTLQKVAPRIGPLKIPGVCALSGRRQMKRDAMVKLSGVKSIKEAGEGQQLGPTSLCTWQKGHSEATHVWRCTNRVLMHPVLRGSYLPFCGFHAPRCIQEYGKGKKDQMCPSIVRRNRFGMCRNHLEAHLTGLSFEERGSVLLIDSDFDVPGIKESKIEEVVIPVTRHSLAPKYPPPIISGPNSPKISIEITNAVVVLPDHPSRTLLEKFVKKARALVKKTTRDALDHPNPVSGVVKEVIWRVQFIRRAEVVATRIQRIFRGNRARRRVRLLHYEQAAVDRIKACRIIQRFVRGFVGRRRFVHEHENVHNAVPHIQRLLRGALARKHFREVCAAIRLQRNFRWYRQYLFARTLREEVAYMQGLQVEADQNLIDLEKQISTFRWLRARRVLRTHMMRWKRRQALHEQEIAERLRNLLGTVKIQRQWRRYHRYKLIKKRYESAQLVQKRVRGWLTRHMWVDDPGVHFIKSFFNTRSGLQYGKFVIEWQPSKSYSYPSRKIRTCLGVLTIQRVFRGHLGRLTANTRWAGILKRWEWLGITPMEPNGYLSDSMTVGHQRYGFLLPSFAYHKDRSQHMLPVANELVPNRGHAYKYQYILDLIKDRYGKRGWSLAKEEMYARQLKEEDEWLRAEEALRDAKDAEIAMKALRQHISTTQDRLLESMPISKAVFPVGTVVDVIGKMEGKRIVRRAKIITIRPEKLRNGERSASFDIEYLKSLRSSFGRFEESGEQRVSVTRLRHNPLVCIEMNPKRDVGVLIQATINRLRHEITSSQRTQDDLTQVTSQENEDNEIVYSVGAIADRLRDCREGNNLLHDHREFVDFLFKNSTVLKLTWLQVVNQVRYGTSSKKLGHPAQEAIHSSSPSMEMLHRKFGFGDGQTEKLIRPMPERANAIEERMAKLGFQYNSNDNVSDNKTSADEQRYTNEATRPETTSIPREVLPNRNVMTTVDDMMLFREDPTPQNAQDMHRLIYELKALPREARQDQIIHIASRRSHAYVCGHPACGKCFSSRKMARLHQLTTHEGQERLARGNALVDQYFHPYWPQDTPWDQAKNKVMVGYFGCHRSGCEKLQLRTRQELNRHNAHVHGIKQNDHESGSSCATRLSLLIDAPKTEKLQRSSEETGSINRATQTRKAIWLGTYLVCRNLEAKLGIGPTSLSPKVCIVHENPVKRCTACFLQQRRPTSPFRLYSAFAVRRDQAGVTPFRIEADIPAEPSQDEQYTIFRDDDDGFCPAVNIWGVYSLSVAPKRMDHKNVVFPDPISSVLYLKITTICRDAAGEAWIFGYVLAHQKSSDAKFGDEHEVVLDTDRGLVFALLSEVVGSACIHYCSKNMFYRKHYSMPENDIEPNGSVASLASCPLPRNLYCRPSRLTQVLQE